MFKYIRCFKNEKYTSWNCPLPWPWGAVRGSWLSLTQASWRGEGRVEGRCWAWFPASRLSRAPVMWAVGDLASLPTQGAMI